MTDTTTAARTALVTGATSGIGRAVAQLLARDGLRLILSGRDQGRGLELADELGGGTRFVEADLDVLPGDVG